MTIFIQKMKANRGLQHQKHHNMWHEATEQESIAQEIEVMYQTVFG